MITKADLTIIISNLLCERVITKQMVSHMKYPNAHKMVLREFVRIQPSKKLNSSLAKLAKAIHIYRFQFEI